MYQILCIFQPFWLGSLEKTCPTVKNRFCPFLVLILFLYSFFRPIFVCFCFHLILFFSRLVNYERRNDLVFDDAKMHPLTQQNILYNNVQNTRRAQAMCKRYNIIPFLQLQIARWLIDVQSEFAGQFLSSHGFLHWRFLHIKLFAHCESVEHLVP